MASLEKKQAQLITWFNRALVHSVLLSDCKTGLGPPNRSAEEIHTAMLAGERPDSLLTKAVPVENCLLEALDNAKRYITSIDLTRVRLLRSANQPTKEIFEHPIDMSVFVLTDSPTSAQYYLRECFENQIQYTAEGVEHLAKVHQLILRIRRRLIFFASRMLSFLVSGWMLTILILITLASVPIFYYLNVSSASNAPTLISAAPIAAAAKAPDESFFQKTTNVIGMTSSAIDDISKIMAALVAAWSFVCLRLRR
jgi:hypothetical protein